MKILLKIIHERTHTHIHTHARTHAHIHKINTEVSEEQFAFFQERKKKNRTRRNNILVGNAGTKREKNLNMCAGHYNKALNCIMYDKLLL